MSFARILNSDNINELFDELKKEYPKTKWQDLVNNILNVFCLSENDEEKVLKEILPSGQRRGNFFYNEDYIYRLVFDPKKFDSDYGVLNYLGDLTKKSYLVHSLFKNDLSWYGWAENLEEEIEQNFKKIKESLTLGEWQVFNWRDEYVKKPPNTKNILTLIKHVTGLEKDLDIFFFIVKILGIKLDAKDSFQSSTLYGNLYIPYTGSYKRIRANQLDSNCFGELKETIPLQTNKKNNFAKLHLFRKDNDTIHLFETVQFSKQSKEIGFHYVAPPSEFIILNKDVVEKRKHFPVFIHDYISRFTNRESGVPKIISTNTFNSIKGINTWSGYYAMSAKIDWSVLKNREAIFVFDDTNFESIRIGVFIFKNFKEFGGKLRFLKTNVTSHVNRNFKDSSDDKEFWDFIDVKSFKDLAKMSGLKNLDVFTKPKEEGWVDKPLYKKLSSNIHVKKPKRILDPIISEGNVVLLCGQAKMGKSFFALDVALSLATGGSIGEYLKSKKKCNVLYIDGEMTTVEQVERVVKLKGDKSYAENIDYLNMFENKIHLDISRPEGISFINSQLIENPDLLILDNLGTIMSANKINNAAECTEVFKKLKYIAQEKGVTIIVVHHVTKGGEIRGSSKIVDGVDLVLELKRDKKIKDHKGYFEVSIPFARNLSSQEKESIFIRYEEEDSKIERLVGRKLLDVGVVRGVTVSSLSEASMKVTSKEEIFITVELAPEGKRFTAKGLAAEHSCSTKTADRALLSLHSAGVVEIDNSKSPREFYKLKSE